MIKLAIRRTIVVAAVVLSLALGGVAVRAAAAWTAASAPLEAPPVSADTLGQQLADEQQRSAALEAQLAGLMNQSNDLSDALQAARDRATSDSRTAKSLQAQLAAAQKKLAALEQAARRAAAQRAASSAATPRPTAHATSGASGQGGEGGGDD